jgi:hypothetical protein
MRAYLTRKGQSTLEYAILVLIVIVALLAMQTYMKRGLQGRVRESTDNIGEAYSPGYTTSAITSTSTSTGNEKIAGGTAPTQRTTLDSMVDNRLGGETIPSYGSETWSG